MTPKQVIDSLVYLSSCRDGAGAKDEQGFNRRDSYFGKSLAKQARERGLTARQVYKAREMLVKYSKQLRGAGII